MDVQKIVAEYATKNGKGVEIDITALAANKNFQKAVVKQVVAAVQEKPQACVLIPAYKSRANNNHLGQLINEIALTLQVKTLVTGDVKNLKSLLLKPSEVILLKQSFRLGKELKQQIADIKEMGFTVSVLCILTHSKARLEAFGKENAVEITAIANTGE